MRTIHLNSTNLKMWQEQATESVMALGFFDGIHSGHEKVIRTAGQIAKEKNLKATVMSFFPHPKTVISQSDEPFDYLMSLEKKAAILENLGVETLYIVKFDQEFLSLPPKQFVSSYLRDMKVVHAVAGFDFSYGHRGAGKIDHIHSDADGKIAVTKVAEVSYDGEKVSSTWVRELIHQGEMELLEHVLGRNYETAVYWDSDCFKLAPYFMLPVEGKYHVTLKNEYFSEEQTVFIPSCRTRVIPLGTKIQQFSKNEQVEIIWHKQLILEKVSI